MDGCIVNVTVAAAALTAVCERHQEWFRFGPVNAFAVAVGVKIVFWVVLVTAAIVSVLVISVTNVIDYSRI